MQQPTLIQILSAAIFGLALIHTFSTKFFENLAHKYPKHSGVLHLLAEVEVVFGFWALVLVLFILGVEGQQTALTYINSRNFTEPLFVFAIMVVAGTKPILQFASQCVQFLVRSTPLPTSLTMYFFSLSVIPLIGSFITEPAAMTLAALLLRDTLFSKKISAPLQYVTLGVLFVNVSIGGTLTPFAAPPVLMVASQWGWDLPFMLRHFAVPTLSAVALNAALATLLFRKELMSVNAAQPSKSTSQAVPLGISLIHIFFLVLIVIFNHYPVIFIGVFLFFLGFTVAYQRYQQPLILREALLVAYFLGGLVVLGGQQQWWLEPLLTQLSSDAVFWGAIGLTAITDNAALTYLGSQAPGLSDELKLALVAGAVTGGGLTVIANAPNPAGFAILKGKFLNQAISPLYLFLAALVPTLITAVAYRLL